MTNLAAELKNAFLKARSSLGWNATQDDVVNRALEALAERGLITINSAAPALAPPYFHLGADAETLHSAG